MTNQSSFLRRFTLVLLLTTLTVPLACRYSKPAWLIESHHLVVHKNADRFGMAFVSTLARDPEGFVAQFPDGGTPKVLRQKITVWMVNADTLAPVKLAEFDRPNGMRSGLAVHCLGWDEAGNFYVTVTGREGKTSDTPFVRKNYQFRTDGSWSEISDPPATQPSVQSGPLADVKLYVSITPNPQTRVMVVELSRGYPIKTEDVLRIQPDGEVERIAR